MWSAQQMGDGAFHLVEAARRREAIVPVVRAGLVFGRPRTRRSKGSGQVAPRLAGRTQLDGYDTRRGRETGLEREGNRQERIHRR
jgi:hypothetical protein